MTSQPFSLLKPYASRLRVVLTEKNDDVMQDAAGAALVGCTNAAGLWQVHGGTAVTVREPTARTIKADGMATDRKNLALCLRAADCQTFLVYAPERHVVGLLHAGWKGLLAGMIPTFFAHLKSEWGIGGKDVLVGAGPSLCKQCSQFTDPARELPGFPGDLIDGRLADLRSAAERQLQSCGVAMTSFERHPDCTRCSPETWWSYRGGHKNEVLNGHTNMLIAALV